MVNGAESRDAPALPTQRVASSVPGTDHAVGSELSLQRNGGQCTQRVLTDLQQLSP
jgi:hypothetical protein